jgi:ABC-type phosphate transport system auxiliary subunit
MTETYLIEINSEHKQTLMDIFKAFKVRITPTEALKDPQSLTDFFKKHKLSKKDQQFFRELQASIEETYAIERGEIEPTQTYEELLAELNQIAENENRTYQAV